MVNTDLLAEAFSIRKCLHEQWQDLLLSACEKVFDKAVKDDHTIHVPKLELSIKVTSEQELMEVLPELIQQQVKEQLESINWQTTPTTLSPIVWQETTAKQDQFATLLYYLRTGSVSWQSAYAETSMIASELKETCRQQQTQIINYLSNQPETVSFYFRLLQLLPEAEYLVIANTLLERFSSALRTTIAEFIRFVISISNNSVSRYTQEQILATTLAECSSQSEQYLIANFKKIITNVITETGSDYCIFLRGVPNTFTILFESQTRNEQSNILDISTMDATRNQWEILINYLQTGTVFREIADISSSLITADLRTIYQQQRSQLLSHLSNQQETESFYFRLLQLLPEAEYLVIANSLLDRFSSELRATINKFIRLVITISNNSVSRYTQEQILAAILAECSSQSEQYLTANLKKIIINIITKTGSDHRIFLRDVPDPDTSAILVESQTRDDQSNILDISTVDTTTNQWEILINYLQTGAFVWEAANISTSQIIVNLRKIYQQSKQQIIEVILSEFSGQSEEKFRANFSKFIDSIVPHLSLSNVEQYFSNNHNLAIPNQAITVTGDQFALCVNYAGLVLLHPFISRFFEATGVQENNSKTIIDSRIARAAVLLHFLATGKEELYEYELGLIKILLGLEPETPLLVSSGLLQDGDQEEAETVLQSTINYWTVLKNTSINGLRSSFLQRSGLVRRTENGWKLQLETQSFDMLLEYLPWTISIIKLPWMKYPLYTEWQTF